MNVVRVIASWDNGISPGANCHHRRKRSGQCAGKGYASFPDVTWLTVAPRPGDKQSLGMEHDRRRYLCSLRRNGTTPNCAVPYRTVAWFRPQRWKRDLPGHGPALHRTPHWSAGLAARARGFSPVLVYLFRDRDRPKTFAYSTDVTGRDLARQRPGTNWAFVTVASHHDLPEGEEAMRHLQRQGFYIFES